MKVKDFLKEYINKSIQYHVFDSQQELSNSQGSGHKEQNYKVYCYNITMNNKPRGGDIFLYRRPGKVTKDRKFVIYGGGVIDTITAPDKEGNVKANIIKGFKLKNPLIQGSKEIEDFQWTFKNKKPGSWAHFWSLYGMNVINYSDFIRLVGDSECEDATNTDSSDASMEEYLNDKQTHKQVLDEVDLSHNLTLEIENVSNNTDITVKQQKRYLSYHVGALEMLSENDYYGPTFGIICERLVCALLEEKYKEEIKEKKVNVSLYQNDAVDIVVYFSDGYEEYINVKASHSHVRDGFYLSPQEVEFSKRYGKSYKLYRLYDVDLKAGKMKIRIYEGPFDSDHYRMAVTAWKIYEK